MSDPVVMAECEIIMAAGVLRNAMDADKRLRAIMGRPEHQAVNAAATALADALANALGAV
jgi:hypothetical protein